MYSKKNWRLYFNEVCDDDNTRLQSPVINTKTGTTVTDRDNSWTERDRTPLSWRISSLPTQHNINPISRTKGGHPLRCLPSERQKRRHRGTGAEYHSCRARSRLSHIACDLCNCCWVTSLRFLPDGNIEMTQTTCYQIHDLHHL